MKETDLASISAIEEGRMKNPKKNVGISIL